MKRLTSLNEIVRTSGVTLFVAFIVSIVILGLSPTDSGQRGFGHGAVDAVCWLYLLWVGVAVVAIARNLAAPKYFWAVFTANTVISMLTVAHALD